MASASASRADTFECSIENLYSVITDYESYPDFVDGVSSVNVLEQDENGARVEYSLNIIKKFKYILKMTHEKPNKVAWEFESGDLFKINAGSWELADNGSGHTDVKYNCEIEVKGFFPGAKMIVKTLTTVNLPSMMKTYEERAKNLG